VTSTAVPIKVMVATRLYSEPNDVPLSPLPEVQPRAILAPKPTRTPAAHDVERWALEQQVAHRDNTF
jgi:hypothetical protein